MTSPFIQRFQTMSAQTVSQPTRLLPAETIAPQAGGKRYNPFLTAMNNDSADFQDMYGVNKPLTKPMFLGYKEDKAVFAGSRLFILY